MPKSSKRCGSRRGTHAVHQTTQSADVTVSDYADAITTKARLPSDRLKKAVINAWSHKAKEMNGQSGELASSLAWYERELSDFESADEDENTYSNPNVDEHATEVRSKKKNIDERHKVVSNDGHEYPLDLWCLLGEYVFPEDMSRFSAICKGAYIVVQTAKFWNTMYKRFYDPEKSLPQDLKPENIFVHGMKAKVIRSLFFNYEPFVKRLQHLVPFENLPYDLEGSRCILMWHQKLRAKWHLYFKFHKTLAGYGTKRTKSRRDQLHQMSDINYNPEEYCCILEVVTDSFISLPVVMGHVLIKAYLNVGHDMRHHKLKLVFNTQYVKNSVGSEGLVASIDPAYNVFVRHWWDTRYPIYVN